MPFDFDAAVQAPFRMQPGLRRVAPGQPVLTPTVAPQADAGRHLREKLAVLGAYADQALCSTPGFDASPALQALATEAAQSHPQALTCEGQVWRAPALGWELDADDAAHPIRGGAWPAVGPLLSRQPRPWRRAALLALAFAEDLAIVDGASGTIPWLAVALPSSWSPQEKVGLPFGAVHAPVADNRLIQQAAERLVALVTGGDRWERFVWTLSPHPRLHAHPLRVPPERWPAALDGEALAALTWWRTEHQTFLPVPGRAQAVFTIRVDTQPMAQALSEPARAARVHDALASMNAAVLAYRGLTDVQPRLLDWLARRAAA